MSRDSTDPSFDFTCVSLSAVPVVVLLLLASDIISNVKIVRFSDINVKLDNEKTYLIRIDVPQSVVSCNRVAAGQKDLTKSYFVHSSARYYRNEYYERMGFDDGKVYEIEFC